MARVRFVVRVSFVIEVRVSVSIRVRVMVIVKVLLPVCTPATLSPVTRSPIICFRVGFTFA